MSVWLAPSPHGGTDATNLPRLMENIECEFDPAIADKHWRGSILRQAAINLMSTRTPLRHEGNGDRVPW